MLGSSVGYDKVSGARFQVAGHAHPQQIARVTPYGFAALREIAPALRGTATDGQSGLKHA
jgi:hypothetical protein